jgi:membrane-bound serine protease (ClpP class)
VHACSSSFLSRCFLARAGAAAALGAVGCVLALSLPEAVRAAERVAFVVELDGAVNPVATEFISQSIERAEKEEAACLILELDTPGGLYKSTHVICKAILASRVPFVTYVAPAGARATSAGVFITYASHVAAMHSASAIGAAHPVNLGGPADSTMSEKAENDAVAFIRSLAARHGRNAEWAEEAVRKSRSITAGEALKLGVADIVVEDVPGLLAALDGRKVRMEHGEEEIHSAGAEVVRLEMNWRHRILDHVSDPNVAYVLMTLGMLGMLFELYNPGTLLPGVMGSIFLILAFYGLHTLPINYAGLLLIFVAIVLFILEVKVTSYGMLTIGGVVAMLFGSLMLIDIDPSIEADFLRIRLGVIIPAVAATALFFAFAVTKGILAQRRQPAGGLAGLIGESGVARTPLQPGSEGRVLVHGELWTAESTEPIQSGERVRVLGGEGLRLRVGRG